MGFKNEVRTEAVIEGTAGEVWGVLTDFARYGDWNPGMRQVQGQAVAGSRITIRFSREGKRTITMKPTILVADRDRELRWIGRLLMRGVFDGEHRFEIHEEGPRSVRFVQAERFAGVLVPFLRTMIEVETVATFTAVNEALARRVAELRDPRVA